MSYHGHFEKPKPPKKKMKRGKKIALIIVAILLVLVIAAVIFGISTYKSMIGKVNYVEMPKVTTTAPTTAPTQTTAETEVTVTTEPTTVETTRPPMTSEDIVNILVVGQSSRAGEEGRLADTMILATVNKYDKTLTLTSFLRDAYVDLPDYRQSNGRLRTCGWNKLTSCYALGYSFEGTVGAMTMMNDCLYNNFGVEVDYNVEIDFECFIKLVDILDGVALEITQEEADYLNADDRFVSGEYQAGWATMDGAAALSYARMRKAAGDNDSDIKRTARQRKLIDALLNNVKSLNMTKIRKIADEVLPLVTTNMSPDTITEFLLEIVPILPELNVTKGGTCPVETTYWSSLENTPDGELWVLAFDAGQNKKLMRAFTEVE